METGTISVDALQGDMDLQSTLESGQSYLWDRPDGRMYETTGAHGGSAWYRTVLEGEVVRVRQIDGRLEWESTTDAAPILRELLRLDDDLPALLPAQPGDDLVAAALAAFEGMRLVRDPFFPCLISFICSAQMRVERIHGMQRALVSTFGDPVSVEGELRHGYPRPERLAAATEAELRDLGIGYRAPYVKATAEMVADGELGPADLPGDYEAARSALTAFPGVGDKVADCVLLFSLGYLEAVPIDTWIRTAIADHYPGCERGSYEATSRALRETFEPTPGYVQTYLFHYLRHRF